MHFRVKTTNKTQTTDTNLPHYCSHLTAQLLTQVLPPILGLILFKRYFLSSVTYSDHSEIVTVIVLKILVYEFSSTWKECLSLIHQSDSLGSLQIQKQTLKIFFESLTPINNLLKMKQNLKPQRLWQMTEKLPGTFTLSQCLTFPQGQSSHFGKYCVSQCKNNITILLFDTNE